MERIYIHNTYSGQKEVFIPLRENTVGLYCCGPTVYNFAHIGNLRTYLFEDLLRRTFEFFGYRVNHVMNITDIGHLTNDTDDGEDKMLQSAQAQKKSVHEIATFYTDAFFKDCTHLNILHPSVVCKATEHINEMITLAKDIEAHGFSYISGGNVYFDTSKFKNYGLQKGTQNKELLRSRVGHDQSKKNTNDFVLWFTKSKYKNHTMLWDSPWGKGYPGWHLECSAMSIRYLGEQFDIHCGGIDHIPIHHTNEIAQVEAITNRQWVRYWVHGEFLLMNEKKISKSAGGFVTLPDLSTNGFDPLDFRYLCLSGHYRSQLQFSLDALNTARNARLRLMERIARAAQKNTDLLRIVAEISWEDITEHGKHIYKNGARAIAHDLNSPQLLSVVWALAKDTSLSSIHKLWLIHKFDAILGLNILSTCVSSTSTREDPNYLSDTAINTLMNKRVLARKNKNWGAADEIRMQLHQHGVEITDDLDGSHWTRT